MADSGEGRLEREEVSQMTYIAALAAYIAAIIAVVLFVRGARK